MATKLSRRKLSCVIFLFEWNLVETRRGLLLKCKLLGFLCTVILTSWIIKHLLNCKSLAAAAFPGPLPTTLIANHSSTRKCPKPKIIQDSTNTRFVMDFFTGKLSNWLKYFPFWKKNFPGKQWIYGPNLIFFHGLYILEASTIFKFSTHSVFESKDMVIKCGVVSCVLKLRILHF